MMIAEVEKKARAFIGSTLQKIIATRYNGRSSQL